MLLNEEQYLVFFSEIFRIGKKQYKIRRKNHGLIADNIVYY